MQTIDEALTFDDVLLQPAYSEILPREVSLQTRLTRGLTLKAPRELLKIRSLGPLRGRRG